MNSICLVLQRAIKELYELDILPELTPSPDNIDADYSSNIPLKLAKELHRPPMQIAEELQQKIQSTRLADAGQIDNFISCAISAPGFLNFTLSYEYLVTESAKFVQDFSGNISSDEYLNKTVICEFSDPNPFKVLHVGHLYTSIVGDSISRLFEFASAKVIRANFGGDVGLHVAKTMYGLQQKDLKDLTIEDIAQCYVAGTRAYDEDATAHAEIVALNQEIYRINAEDVHDTALAKLYWHGRELSYDYFKDFYQQIGITFDKYYPESTVAQRGLVAVRQGLSQGVYEESNGAIIYRGEKIGLHTRVFINNNGLPTYETKDVGLIYTKWDDYHFDKSVVITGNDIIDYMKVVLASVSEMTPELPERTTHLTHGQVKLPGNEKMSSRKGNFLKAVDILHMVKTELKSEYNSTDGKVILAAIKYAFLKYKIGGDIIFDLKESIKMTGNSGPYLLYSAVRAKKILQKAATTSSSEHPADTKKSESDQNSTIAESCERALMKKFLEYQSVLDAAVAEMAPYKIANYLYSLAQEFSRFYENCPVAGSSREVERLQLVKLYLDIITHGLDLLGIEIPEEM